MGYVLGGGCVCVCGVVALRWTKGSLGACKVIFEGTFHMGLRRG